MPNMDDIAFFETSSYSHRGGIYADAVRKPASEAEEQLSPHDDETAKTGGQLPEGYVVNATDEVKEHPPIPTSVSDDRLVASVPPTDTLSQPDTSPASRAATINLPIQSSPPKSHSKQKSWFLSAGSQNDITTVEPPAPPRPDHLTPATEPVTPRGRTPGAVADAPPKRGTSAPPGGDSLDGSGSIQI